MKVDGFDKPLVLGEVYQQDKDFFMVDVAGRIHHISKPAESNIQYRKVPDRLK